jgi:16S rRNA (cytosine967-C5)-methyltransferase
VKLLETRARLGLSNLHAAQADGTRPPIREADAVLLDVPCSGTGTLGRHPDGRWRLRRDEFDVLVDLQRGLLDAAAEIVRPGGLLVYATCSLEREENEGQVGAFLSRRREFEREPGGAPVRAELLDAEGDLVVLPQRDGMDGAYAARLRRSGG